MAWKAWSRDNTFDSHCCPTSSFQVGEFNIGFTNSEGSSASVRQIILSPPLKAVFRRAYAKPIGARNEHQHGSNRERHASHANKAQARTPGEVRTLVSSRS